MRMIPLTILRMIVIVTVWMLMMTEFITRLISLRKVWLITFIFTSLFYFLFLLLFFFWSHLFYAWFGSFLDILIIFIFFILSLFLFWFCIGRIVSFVSFLGSPMLINLSTILVHWCFSLILFLFVSRGWLTILLVSSLLTVRRNIVWKTIFISSCKSIFNLTLFFLSWRFLSEIFNVFHHLLINFFIRIGIIFRIFPHNSLSSIYWIMMFIRLLLYRIRFLIIFELFNLF